MRRIEHRLLFAPSDLASFMESRFVSWMTRFDLERPGELQRDAEDPILETVRRHGREHEARVLETLRDSGLTIAEIPDEGDRHQITLKTMHEGPDVVYQAWMSDGSFNGACDFLLRRRGRSKLGEFVYEPLEAKLARRVKPSAVIQLGCYARMLETIQGAEVRHLHLALGDGRRVEIPYPSVRFFCDALRGEFLQFHDDFDPASPREPEPGIDHSPWEGEAERRIRETDGPSQVARITRSQIRCLESQGITTLGGLADHDGSAVEGIQGSTLERLTAQARLQRESRGRDRPVFELIEVPRRGVTLADVPPASKLDVAFDLEGYPLVTNGLEYLWGALDTDGFYDWWAFDAAQERAAFESFVRWILERRRLDPEMHVYHYGPYETSVLKRLSARHGLLEAELDVLLREERFVDLLAVVRNTVRIGEPAYSLKNVEKLYRDPRVGEVETAADSIVEYDRWQLSGDPPDWRRSEILASIRRYNHEDCASTLELAAWLRARREGAGADVSHRIEERPESDQRRQERERRTRLVEHLQGGRGDSPWASLLADLLEFHQREERPAWWAFFDQRDMSEEQLVEDFNCLAGLRYMRPARNSNSGRAFRYDFEPGQQTRIKAGSNCYLNGDFELPANVLAIELERGAVSLEFPWGTWNVLDRTPPPRLTLIPREIYRTHTISAAILCLAQRYADRGELPSALEHYLERRRPVLAGQDEGPLVHEGETATDAVPRLCAAMRDTTLVVQGPPGSGKTVTAARAIVELLENGATVGVASNSHKAILNLLAKCVDVGPEGLAPLKAGGDAGDAFFRSHPSLRWLQRTSDVEPLLDRHRLAGGTAWLFSRQELEGRFDYLFVDEAGQVPLANLVAMAACARNLVLVGDPIQLPQPTQAAHPGESGRSTLEYALNGQTTIDPQSGVFLDRSFRLHPALCGLISEAFYEGRLSAAPDRENRTLRLSPELENELRPAGLSFVPVLHEGRAQSSPEEAEKIAELIERLARSRITDLDGRDCGEPGYEKILVVAPYNLQVQLLERVLPSAVRVGTVDKFQGQEAPIVIVSMSSSDAHRSPRGLDFLLDPNRLNVALSRAQSAAIVVANPGLVRTRAQSLEQMERINLFCRILAEGAV